MAPWLYVVFVVLEFFLVIDEVVESKVWLALLWCVPMVHWMGLGMYTFRCCGPTTAARPGGRTGGRA